LVETTDVLRFLLGLASAALLGGCVAALALRLRARRVVGEVIERSVLPPRPRLVAILLAAAGGFAALGAGDVGLAWTLPPLALAIVYLALRPGVHDRVTGRDGVRRGWYVRALADLEEWRLTGDHLRFRLRGRWEAVPLAAARQAELGERLRATAPERESTFAT
jgi:hypothetical protein